MKHLLLLCGVLLLLQGCAGGRDFEYKASTDHPDGPGLITGDEQQYHIMKAKEKSEEASEEKGVETNTEKQ